MARHYFAAAVSIVYLLNFTLGVFEIPDNLPFVGNLDELAASGLLFHSIQEIRKQRKLKKEERPGESEL
ncbi:MAG: hypothetical protein MI748_17740 [Opitutales bacterium]|nr:hypothetical protein [Opitutales bacterium]